MVDCLKRLTIICILVLVANTLIANDLVINEVMSNEPGGDKKLEWIEIYNNASGIKNLSFYKFIIDGTPLDPPDFVIIEAGQYGVLCGDVVKYDSVWGDNSGTWGDNSSLENYPVFGMSGLNLINDSGIIFLIDYLFVDTVSQFKWYSKGDDGISWERLLPDSMEVRNSVDPFGCTPGRINSVTPRANDLGIASVKVWPDILYETGFEITVVNYGLQPVAETTLTIYYDLDKDSIVENDDLIAIIYLPPTNPGDTLKITVYFELNGVMPYVLIKLPDDEQPLNDLLLIQAFGREYPPIIISEFLADPNTALGVEWVELKNRSELDVNLNGWLLGDEKTFHPITDSEYVLGHGKYLVLCKDSAALADYYTDDSMLILKMSSWAILNNDDDIVRLKDKYGYVVDSVQYDHTFGGNHSWGRDDENGETDHWGWSVSPGGTPGKMNEVYLEPSGSSITLSAEPNPFSPTHDGEMTIDFIVPPGDNITLKIYDLKGRVVRTLIDGIAAYDGSVVWHGESDSGRRLRMGMYILYLEVSGVEQYKQTIVIAP